ncbi:lipase family protein [Tsukamurella sp. 8F]|uniref:alpha/beta hydrolase n=1 Tax=unclassified Tsukamurella TaxID=2633480 RepID=UPI0023B9F3B9|nr:MULTISPECIES: lipase family protein [unclassified Tsukamurella]MDF0532150.1 lipase family protein [Tsukamurella sp. 8J]MDF0589434.1 lipase family protein [Tsukamurella sp. 8F]
MLSPRRGRAVVALFGLLMLAASCTRAVPTGAAPAPPLPRALPAVTAGVDTARGHIVERSGYPGLAASVASAASAVARARYVSASGIDGSRTEVTGSFFVPRGPAPVGGWPVVSFAHGTTGATQDCGPSSDSQLRGFAGYVAAILKAGYAAAVTDYQGLDGRTRSGSGQHPYLEPRTAALNVIDAVRALRELSPAVSNRWVAVGISQGGQAAWSADELAGRFGGGLQLLGAAALAPAADISEIADRAWEGTLTTGQVALMPMVVTGLSRAYGLDTTPYLHGFAASPLLLGCGTATQAAMAAVRAADLRPDSQGAAIELRDLLRADSLPQGRLTAPLLVVNGDEDDIVLPRWTDVAVGRACAAGGVVSHRVLSGVGHNDTVPDGDVARWIADRFAGSPAPSTCGKGHG